ncbi:MAG: ABC transporter ATP-binding protein [Ignavibacteriae bacterium]|nr:ABC transporter ATP-binding protein [Ignavibacteriota bacterium]
MLEIKKLTKFYGQTKVLENINLNIDKGLIVGLLGANGAGKTTLQNTIMNTVEFDGEVLIDGIANDEFLNKHRNKVLYLPDTPFLYEFLTGIEFVKFVLDMQKIQYNEVQEKVELLIKLFNLEDFKDHLIKEYSHGMKHKIALISILVQSPKILLLDEPVSGLDTMSIIALKKLLKSMANDGTTIIFSTHILDLVENLCDTIIILHDNNSTTHNEVNKMNKSDIEKIYLDIVGNEIDLILNKI